MKLSQKDEAWLVAMLAGVLYWRAKAARRLTRAVPDSGTLHKPRR